MGVDTWTLSGGFGVENLRRRESARAALGPDQVRIAVKAISLNYRDLLMVRGQYNPRQPLPLIPCSDAVGVVTEVGAAVTRWSVGDRVCPIFASGWLDGQPPADVLTMTRGGPRSGTLARELVVQAAALVAPPAHLTDVECATLPCAAVTAWRALMVSGQLQPGETVLVLGTGGVSMFALQLAVRSGARVVITSSCDDKLQLAYAMGASYGVNYADRPQWGRDVRAWTGGEGVDHVVEVGGAGTLEQSLRAVRTGGHIALIGVLSGTTSSLHLTRVLMNQVRIQGIMVGSRQDFSALSEMLEAHSDVRPCVSRVFSFDEVPEAFQHLEAARHVGKICIEVGDA